MEAYQEYLDMFNIFNVGTIIVFSIILIVFYIVISIVKHNMLVNTIKKAVKEAIKELNTEQIDKTKQAETKIEELDMKEDNIQK